MSSHIHLRDIPHWLGLHLHPEHYHQKDEYSNFPVAPLGGNRPFPIPQSSESSTSTSSSDEDDERKSSSRTREKVKRIKEKVRHRSRSNSRSRKRRSSTSTGRPRLTIGEDDEDKKEERHDATDTSKLAVPNMNTPPQITKTPATPSEGSRRTSTTSNSTTTGIRRSKTQPTIRRKSNLSQYNTYHRPVSMLEESDFLATSSALRDDNNNSTNTYIKMPDYPATPDFVDGEDYISSTTVDTGRNREDEDNVDSSPSSITDTSIIPAPLVPGRSARKRSTHRRQPIPQTFRPSSENPPSPPPGIFEIDSSRELPRPRSNTLPAYLVTPIEDPFGPLSTLTTTFLIDDSPSMTLESRWSDTITALCTIAETASHYSTSGISIRFLNQTDKDRFEITSGKQVEEMFKDIGPVETGGSTPIGGRLDEILREYLDQYRRWRKRHKKEIRRREREKENVNNNNNNNNNNNHHSHRHARAPTERPKPLSIIVLTDGDATDDPESVIVSVAKELDRLNAPLMQVGIQLFQVGNDKDARVFLKELDDELGGAYGVRDIVDTVWFGKRGTERLTADVILKTLVGGWNRRIDAGLLEGR